MSGGSEFQVCGAATENARRANSIQIAMSGLVSDIAIFVLKRDVKLQLTNSYEWSSASLLFVRRDVCALYLQCFDAVGSSSGRASGL